MTTRGLSPSRRPAVLAAAIAVGVGCCAWHPAVATAASPSSSAVTINVRPAPSFIVGDAAVIADDPASEFESSENVVLYITAASSKGIKYYDATVILEDGDSYDQGHFGSGPRANLAFEASDYDGEEGGQSQIQYGWKITAVDKAGRSASEFESFSDQVTAWNNVQEDSEETGDGDSWTFSSGWSKSTCNCAVGGSTTDTNKAGAYGSYVAHVPMSGEHLGLVMPEGPGRGRADVYLDGTKVAVVDTYAAQNTNRIFVWDSGALNKGEHTVKVVNEATSGRPRIDVNEMSAMIALPRS